MVKVVASVGAGRLGQRAKPLPAEMPETISSDSTVVTVCPDDPEAT